MTDSSQVDEILSLIISELMLHVSGVKNKWGSPIVNPPEMNKELDKLYTETKAKIQSMLKEAELKGKYEERALVKQMIGNTAGWKEKQRMMALCDERLTSLNNRLKELTKGNDMANKDRKPPQQPSEPSTAMLKEARINELENIDNSMPSSKNYYNHADVSHAKTEIHLTIKDRIKELRNG